MPDTDVLRKQKRFGCDATVVYAHKLRMGSRHRSEETEEAVSHARYPLGPCCSEVF
jgi:hypothetical protein